jgi:hypothetical protein
MMPAPAALRLASFLGPVCGSEHWPSLAKSLDSVEGRTGAVDRRSGESYRASMLISTNMDGG